MDDVSAITHHIEYLFLKKIIAGLRDKSIDVPKAKQFATDFLGIEPFESVSDAHTKLEQFVAKYPEFEKLSEYVNIYEKESGVSDKINKMREHIRQNNIDAALEVAKE